MHARVPWIARVAVVRVKSLGPVRELVHVELAEHDGTGSRQTRDERRAAGGHGISEDLRAAGRANALCRVEVLRRPGHAVQRPGDLARHQVCLGGPRRLQRGVGGDGDVGAKPGVERGDALEVSADDLHRRDFLGGDHLPEIGHGGPDEVGHQSTRYCVVGSRSSSGRLSRRKGASRSRSTAGRSGSSSASVHAKPPAAAMRFMPSSPISMGASIPLECEAMAVALTILHDSGAAASRRTLSVAPGTTILKAAHAGGVDVTATCGGRGRCTSGRVKFLAGLPPPPTIMDEVQLGADLVREGYRLSCQCVLQESVTVQVAPPLEERSFQMLGAGPGVRELGRVTLDSGIAKQVVKVTLPREEHHQTSDLEQLLAAVGLTTADVGPAVLQGLPSALRDDPAGVTVTTFVAGGASRILAVERGDTALMKFGLAIDVGTTSVVTTLVELESGEQLASGSGLNPRAVLGGGL